MFILAALTACFAVCTWKPTFVCDVIYGTVTNRFNAAHGAFFYAISLQSTARKRSLSEICNCKCCKALLFLLGMSLLPQWISFAYIHE